MPFVKDDPRINRLGKKPGTKNSLTLVKDRVVSILSGRLDDFRKVAELDTPSLLRFVASVMPKDISMTLKPDLTYISSVPRNAIDKPKHKVMIADEPSTTLAEMVDNSIADSTNDDSNADSPPIIGKRVADDTKPMPDTAPIIGKGKSCQQVIHKLSTAPTTGNGKGDVNNAIASPHSGHSSDKVASSTSLKEKKCDEVERKKEVQPVGVFPKITKRADN